MVHEFGVSGHLDDPKGRIDLPGLRDIKLLGGTVEAPRTMNYEL
jgi:hypothetical protein